MEYCKVFATPDEIESLKRCLNMPYIIIAGREPESPQKAAHRIALSHGLPEIPGYYGCEVRTGEFVKD